MAEKNPFNPTDKEVVQQLITRLRGRKTENTGQTRLAE